MSEIVSLLKAESHLEKNTIDSGYDFKAKNFRSDNCAVIVEPREHEMLEPVIRNLLPRLNKIQNFNKRDEDKWNLHIFCGIKNYEFVKNLLPHWEYKITKLEVEDLTREKYSELLKNEKFWQQIEQENILIFQTDCAVFNGFDIREHLNKGYPFMGSRYNWGPRDEGGALIHDPLSPKELGFNMNGGFSLRKKSAMLSCIEQVSEKDIVAHRENEGQDTSYFESEDVHEDVYFHNALSLLGEDLPTFEDCSKFCFQHDYEGLGGALAVHQYETYCSKENQRYFCRHHQGRKPKLLFYAGYGYEPFNGEDYSGKAGVRGSEIALIKIAEQLTAKYDVYVSGPCISKNIYNNVSYFNSNDGKLQWFLDNVDVHTTIVNRYIHFFVEYTSRSRKHFVWLHDMCYQPFWNGQEFPELGKHLINNLLDKINGFICLSDWHINNIKDLYDIPDKKIYKIGNGIDAEMFNVNAKKIKNRFIYSSLPERGLGILLNWFPDILKELPDAELHVFTDNVPDDLIAKMESAKNVYFHGKVSYEEMIFEFMKADVWLYPNIFLETFCTSALEAQASNCICVTRKYGSLEEVVGKRGIVIDGDPNSQEFKEKTIEKLLYILRNTEEKQKLQNRAKEWALNRSWKDRGLKWIQILSKFPN
jgi:glycosyltransferase involved in cell wall biosynthesis